MNEMSVIDFSIHEANYTTVDKNWEKIVAVYPYNRIYYITDGLAEINLKGKRIVLEPGYLYFLPAFQVTSSVLIKPLTHYYLHFMFESGAAPYDFTNLYSFRMKIKADETDDYMFRYAMINRQTRNISEKIALDASLRYFLSRLIDPEFFQPVMQPWIEKISVYINENIAGEITIDSLAKIAGYNRSYFSVVFKQHFKCSPKIFVLNQKLKKSMVMLMDTNLSITEISKKLNWSSNAYFSRIFKNKVGMSPSEYRSNFQR